MLLSKVQPLLLLLPSFYTMQFNLQCFYFLTQRTADTDSKGFNPPPPNSLNGSLQQFNPQIRFIYYVLVDMLINICTRYLFAVVSNGHGIGRDNTDRI